MLGVCYSFKLLTYCSAVTNKMQRNFLASYLRVCMMSA